MKIMGVHLNQTSYEAASGQIVRWAGSRESKYVCVANVHMLMEAYDSSNFAAVVNNADLVTPDGMPLVWLMRLKGARKQERVYGPTLMLRMLEWAARENIPVGFLGGKPHVLESLTRRMQAQYPGLTVAFSFSPPFRQISDSENASIVESINASGARIVFVGLGCPKQEYWMAEQRGKVQAVMIGVGAAFDFHAGTLPQAPVFMQKLGLEWLFRFLCEPRRLWRRYLIHNPRFLVMALADLLGVAKA
jgi:N-acetylglucosaminyldiphosphoundecaprenol N-acetyl-beta-D-mannosaminyltransferase